MVHACRLMGARITQFPDRLVVQSEGLRSAEDVIDAGNSGQVLRFAGAVAGLLPTYTVITGDASIRGRRPVKPLLEGLTQLGALAVSMRGNDHAPIIVKGPIMGGTALIDGEDSQPVSGLLMAAAFAKGKTELFVTNPGEKPWVGLTLSWFDRLGIEYAQEDFEKYTLPGGSAIEGFEYTVPGDWSSAAYPIAAALATDTEATVTHIDFADAQGDKQLILELEKMGAKMTRGESSLTIHAGSRLKGATIDVNNFIDGITILAVLGCFADGVTQIVGGKIARKKESDRISAIVSELRKMGARIEEREDGLVVEGSTLKGAHVKSFADHRMAMSLAVAALRAQGETMIEGSECVKKSYPAFFNVMNSFSHR